MTERTLADSIYDCERRIGSYIVGGGKVEDKYVQDQIKRVDQYSKELTTILAKGGGNNEAKSR